MLFAIGLHLPLKELAPVRRVALLATLLQMALTVAFGYGLGQFLDLGWVEAIWFGSLLSLSSTAVVLKTLSEQGVMNTLASRVIVGMLIVQDLAVVPLIIMLPEIGKVGEGSRSWASHWCGRRSLSRGWRSSARGSSPG